MSILQKILAHKRDEVADAKKRVSLACLRERVSTQPPTRDLFSALRRNGGQPVRVIAEIKRASPSAGAICPEADPADIAAQYEAAGASAISVLTDRDFFDGRLAFLAQARAAASVPILRKDFIIESYQLWEARAEGADAVLLIVAALAPALLTELLQEARDLGMEPLVEIHNEAEASTALQAGARIVGVNHRDLATFTVDIALSSRLRSQIPSNLVMVGESGIRTRADMDQLGRAGVDAVLIGEGLMRAQRPGDALKQWLR